MADMSAISTLERNVSFFASSALVILAGVLTLLGYLDQAIVLFDDLPLAGEQTRLQWEAKVALLVVIFVYAFSSSPGVCDRSVCRCADRCRTQPGRRRCRRKEMRQAAERIARVVSMAAHHFNFGMRSYFFALAVWPGW